MMDGRSGVVLIPKTCAITRMDRVKDRAKLENHGKINRVGIAGN